MFRINQSEAVKMFDQLERNEVTDEPAESAFAMKGDWDGKAWDPPAREQPGVYAWGEAHLLLAYSVQFEATRDPRYLDTLARRFRTLLSLRDDKVGRRDEMRGRVMPGWGSVRFSYVPHAGKYTSWAVHVGMLLFPAARLVRLATSDPALSQRFAQEIVEFRTAIDESLEAYEDQWHERVCPPHSATGGAGELEGWYTEPILGAAPLPLNQMNTLGRVMLELGLASGEQHYLERATKLARFLKNRMVLRSDSAYQWAYRPSIEPPYSGESVGAEDFSHASVNADFAVACYHAGIVFDRTDMERLAKTLLAVVYQGNGRFADNIDGSGNANLYDDLVAWWGELASIDRRTAQLMAERRQLSTRTSGPGAMLAAAMLAKYTS